MNRPTVSTRNVKRQCVCVRQRELVVACDIDSWHYDVDKITKAKCIGFSVRTVADTVQVDKRKQKHKKNYFLHSKINWEIH